MDLDLATFFNSILHGTQRTDAHKFKFRRIPSMIDYCIWSLLVFTLASCELGYVEFKMS